MMMMIKIWSKIEKKTLNEQLSFSHLVLSSCDNSYNL